MRAAILTAMMSLTPTVPVDIFRFLRVPAIVLTLRARKGRACSDESCGGATHSNGSRSRRSWSASAAAFRRR